MIQQKAKQCKGTGLAKGNGCGKLTIHRKYGLGKMCCLANWYLTSENGKIKLSKETIKVSKPRKDLHNAMTEKKERTSLSTLKKSVETICHKYIRLRDKGKNCISCDIPYKSDFDAGHFYSASKYSNLKFNEDNIHGQCIKCNRFDEGNINGYGVKLRLRIGFEKRFNLEDLAENYKKEFFKWDRQALIEIREYYKLKLKEL